MLVNPFATGYERILDGLNREHTLQDKKLITLQSVG